ncbi:alpha/beta fold hydrolase [Desertimonas flava]|uniref:alpha/beta fold hydrolase n=1 Tax=Desertimonas flava TaxID=2064846 RepID=UPI000E34169D|nr:alpha/beta fold hydrolase [Desertimonas flava]
MMRRRSAVLTAALVALSGVALSTRAAASVPPDDSGPAGTSVETTSDVTSGDTMAASDAAEWQPAPIEWEESEEWPGTQEAWLEVPIDYANPDGGTFELYVTRTPAADPSARVGSLLVNPGGPGFGGSILGSAASQIYNQPLLDAFDIVAWDPRGTGLSEPYIDCIDDYDAYFAGTDITPDDGEERQELIDVAEDFADQCAEKNADIIEFIGTNNSARDMDSIRRALGEETISYFGWSYGSELGATWATLFPDTVRAAVLDGAADPNADLTEGGIQQAEGFEGTLTTYLAECSADPSCAFHNDGDAEGAFDQLMLKLDAKPIPSEPDRPDVTRGVALLATAEAMYSESSWPQLSDALVAAAEGDGSGLLALYDAYYQRQPDGTWDNSLEAFQSIVCMDTADRPTVEQEDADAERYQEVAPRYAPNTTGTYFCTFFPESTDPRVEITGAGAGPIVVCGANGDAATPLASTRNMAAALEDGRLVVIDYDGHTCYGNDPSGCGDEIIDEYLVDLVVPPEVTNCPGVDEDLAAETEPADGTPATTG